MTKVTVIIPSYNVEDYLEECIESVLKQSLKDIEIILVNDGSTDNTLDIIKKYEKKDERIKCIDQVNQGLSVSRNNALDIATGEYIFFLDSDDYISKKSLENLYKKASKDNLDVLYFDATSIYENEKLEKEKSVFSSYYKRNNDYSDVYNGQELFSSMKKNKEFRPNACFQFPRLQFLKDNKIKFVEGIIHEDECFGLEVALLAKRASHIKEEAYIRRVREGSIMTNSKSLKRSYGYFKTIMVISEYIDKYVERKYFNDFYSYVNNLRESSAKYFNECVDKCEIDEFVKHLSISDRYFYKLIVESYGKKVHTIDDLKKNVDLLKKDNKNKSSLKTLTKTKIKNSTKKIKNKIISKLDKTIKVSVIIPVYNCEKFLDECLTSLINQSLKNIEIICVDDSSTDNSYEILNKYKKKDKRIKIFKQEHSNAGNARNLGISKAKGEYLLFLDSDDYFDKDLCLKAYNAAKKNNAEIVLFSATKVDMKNNTKENMNYCLLDTNFVPIKKIFSSDNIALKLYRSSSSAPWSKLFNRKFVLDNKLEFQGLPNANDVFFTRMALSLAHRLYALNDELVYYRFNHGTNSQTLKYKEPLSFIKAYIKLKEELEKRNLFDKYKQTYLNTVICETVYNYNSTKSKDAQDKILKYLKKSGLKELGLENIDEKLIYEDEKYDEFKEIISKLKTSK